MSDHLRSRLALVALALVVPALSSACVVRVQEGRVRTESWSEWRKGEDAAEQSERGRAPVAAPPSDAQRSGKSPLELEILRLELELARLSAASELDAKRGAIEDARAKLALAEAALAAFRELERPLELARAALELDQRADAVGVARAELAQMEHDFAEAGEDFYAASNRDLVVGRSRFRLSVAERELELQHSKHELKVERELVAKELELSQRLEEARRALASAERALVRAELEGRMKVLRAEHALAEAAVAPATKSGAGP